VDLLGVELTLFASLY
jgi:hypothetical protein